MFEKLKGYLLNEEITMRKRGFAFNMLVTDGILLGSLISRFIICGMVLNTWLFLASFVFIALVGFISFKLDKVDVGANILSFFLLFSFFPIMFFTAGGILGDAPLWFLFNILFIYKMMNNKKLKWIFVLFQEMVAIICYLVSYYYPNVILSFKGLQPYLIAFVTLILVSGAIAIIMRTQIDFFEAQNAITEKQKQEIEGLVASQNKFFSSMSHEIRTPINTIIGLNEMILREDISDEIAEDAVNIRAAGKMLLNTINDILDMSKFQSGDMKILLENYHTSNMLSDIVGMIWIRAQEKNLDFRINVAPDIPEELKGDEVRIKQVLINLLNNAIKYTKEGSVVLSVECEKSEDGMCKMIYSVEDTGMGVKKEDIPYLFTAFKRVDESSNKHIEGTGLGLSIVKQFVDLMGGKVSVNSVYTKGSTFIVEIPQKMVSDKELGEYNYEKKHKLAHRTNYKQKFEAPEAKILVVDDNESNLMVVSKLLRDTKIQIDTVKSGAEALKKTLDVKYNLIFMDHLMPEMDGIECFHAIREQSGGMNKETSIVILTANAGEENRALYALTGFNGYLVKPVSGNDLENEVFRQLPRALVKIMDSEGIEVEADSTWISDRHRKRRIAITTESTADLPQVLLDKYNITVLNHKVKTIEGTFREGTEIDTAGLLKYMEDEENVASPVPPSVEDYETFFAEQLVNANNIIHISVSAQIEGTSYMISTEAANSFENVTVFDSKFLSCGQGLMAIFASRMAEAGMPVDEIITRLNTLNGRIRASFMIDNMDYMVRAKQASEGRAGFMKALMLRPVTFMKEGKISTVGFTFGAKERAWRRYIDKCLKGNKIESTVIFINYVGLSKKELDWIKAEIDKRFKFEKVFFQQSCPVVAISCGPGAFGISFVTQ